MSFLYTHGLIGLYNFYLALNRFLCYDLTDDVVCYMLIDQCYIAFHDEEWGVPVHDDRYVIFSLSLSLSFAFALRECSLWIDYKRSYPLNPVCRKLFELLSLSGALAELSWKDILSKRHLFR